MTDINSSYNLINATGLNVVLKIQSFSHWIKSNCMQFTRHIHKRCFQNIRILTVTVNGWGKYSIQRLMNKRLMQLL